MYEVNPTSEPNTIKYSMASTDSVLSRYPSTAPGMEFVPMRLLAPTRCARAVQRETRNASPAPPRGINAATTRAASPSGT